MTRRIPEDPVLRQGCVAITTLAAMYEERIEKPERAIAMISTAANVMLEISNGVLTIDDLAIASGFESAAVADANVVEFFESEVTPEEAESIMRIWDEQDEIYGGGDEQAGRA